MKTYIILLVAALGIGLVACKEDFVEVTDPNSLTANSYPTTLEHLDQMLNGVYGTQHAFGLFGHDMLGKNVYCWDHTTDLEWQGTPTWIALAQNNTQPNDEFLNETWRDAYKGVQRANTLLAGINSYRQQYAQESDEATLKLVEGQAHFLRAWFYYYLITIWGESFIVNGQGGEKLGVPIITEAATNLAATKVARNSVREGWDFIISDLKTAEGLLANQVWTGDNDKHKAGIWAVKGFLGKAYAYTQDWNNAKTYLQDVVTNSGKTLVPFDTYQAMFNGENEFNSESVFEINMNIDKNTWGAWGDQSTGSGIGMVIGPCFKNDNGSTGASGWSNVFPHEKNVRRFGFNEPVYQFTDKSKNEIAPAYVTNSLAIREAKQADPRLWVGCLQPYVDSMTVDDKRRAIVHYGNVETTMQAWSFRKYVNLAGNEYSINVNNGSNFYWMRLADVYLLYAEAAIQTGDAATGLEYINKVRRRAYDYPVDAASPVDYASLTAKTPASDPVLGNDPLKYERWAELFGEGSWWFDVRRWGIGAQEAAYYERVRGGPIQWADTDYAQPIPRSEIEANANARQNPGY